MIAAVALVGSGNSAISVSHILVAKTDTVTALPGSVYVIRIGVESFVIKVSKIKLLKVLKNVKIHEQNGDGNTFDKYRL